MKSVRAGLANLDLRNGAIRQVYLPEKLHAK